MPFVMYQTIRSRAAATATPTPTIPSPPLPPLANASHSISRFECMGSSVYCTRPRYGRLAFASLQKETEPLIAHLLSAHNSNVMCNERARASWNSIDISYSRSIFEAQWMHD